MWLHIHITMYIAKENIHASNMYVRMYVAMYIYTISITALYYFVLSIQLLVILLTNITLVLSFASCYIYHSTSYYPKCMTTLHSNT